MKELIYASPSRFKEIINEPGVKTWLALHNGIYPTGSSFIDRTGTIKLPIRATTLPALALPVADGSFTMSFRDVAVSRAQEIYDRHLATGLPIRISWSGGIDSSSIIAAFIELLGIDRAKECLEIAMTSDSIIENPWGWENIIRKENFKIVNMAHTTGVWDESCINVNGEGGDQIQGTDIYKMLMRMFGSDVWTTPWTPANMQHFVETRTGLPSKEAEHLTNLLISIVKVAPINIETITDFWWWLNITCKWNSICYRLLARHQGTLSQEYLDQYYFPFYNCRNFQLWSIHRREETHKGSWDTYKWAARDFVCDVFNSPEYQLKHRQASLFVVISQTKVSEAIDSEFNFYERIDPIEWYNPDNNFRM